MATRNVKYSSIEPNDNWAGTSVEDSKVPRFTAPTMAPSLTKAPLTSPSKAPEAYHCSPTQQEVDAYVNSLEFEVSQEGVHMRQRRVEQRAQPALTAVRRSNSSGLFWCVVAATLACVWWLSLVFN